MLGLLLGQNCSVFSAMDEEVECMDKAIASVECGLFSRSGAAFVTAKRFFRDSYGDESTRSRRISLRYPPAPGGFAHEQIIILCDPLLGRIYSSEEWIAQEQHLSEIVCQQSSICQRSFVTRAHE